jgi:hypothetical protein
MDILKGHIVMNEFIPSEFYLGQNYPNPFKEKTVIKYCIAYKTRAKLTVYNSEGEVIERLVDEDKKPGTYEIEFSASTCLSRESLPDGKAGGNPGREIFYYRLEAGDYRSEKKMEKEK